MGHLRRFSYEPKVPFIEIEPGRLANIIDVCFLLKGSFTIFRFYVSLQRVRFGDPSSLPQSVL